MPVSVRRASSLGGKEVFHRIKIRGVKTDNGSEFLKDFDAFLQREGIKYYFNYPRYPKVNACVERFNRRLQEDFVEYREKEQREDLEGFKSGLMRYLIWYNKGRIHSGIGGKAPLKYFCEKFL